jgi:hypothetical protein
MDNGIVAVDNALEALWPSPSWHKEFTKVMDTVAMFKTMAYASIAIIASSH